MKKFEIISAFLFRQFFGWSNADPESSERRNSVHGIYSLAWKPVLRKQNPVLMQEKGM